MPWLRFTPEAQALFNRWRADLEFRIRADDLHPAMESHLAKYRKSGPQPRLARAPGGSARGRERGRGVPAARPWPGPSIWRLTLGGSTARPSRLKLVAACELAKHLHQLPEPFTAKEVYRKHWRGLDKEGTTKGIQSLIDYGHLRAVAPEERQAGRPTTRYAVHPDLRREAS